MRSLEDPFCRSSSPGNTVDHLRRQKQNESQPWPEGIQVTGIQVTVRLGARAGMPVDRGALHQVLSLALRPQAQVAPQAFWSAHSIDIPL